MIDIGCGSGRAAFALREEERLTYLGIDVVPDLVEYARQKADRPDWRFELISSIDVPADDASADIVLIMSVFTHLKPGEIKTYLAETFRVLKPGGAVIASYLERENERHRSLFYRPLRNRISRLLGRDVMVSFTTKDELTGWMKDAGFDIDRAIVDGPIGQHVMVGRKPASAENEGTGA
jgi:ubiquinone/menaquinone biosynthesis C-methylase UbiE